MSHTTPPTMRFFFSVFPTFYFKFYNVVAGGCKGKGWIGRKGEISGIEMYDVKSTKKH